MDRPWSTIARTLVSCCHKSRAKDNCQSLTISLPATYMREWFNGFVFWVLGEWHFAFTFIVVVQGGFGAMTYLPTVDSWLNFARIRRVWDRERGMQIRPFLLCQTVAFNSLFIITLNGQSASDSRISLTTFWSRKIWFTWWLVHFQRLTTCTSKQASFLLRLLCHLSHYAHE